MSSGCSWWRKRTTTQQRASGFRAPRTGTEWGGRATRAEINLDAIASNVSALSRHVAPAALMAVVKADGYGHGAVMIAQTSLAAGASMLGVYTAGEGTELRRGGIEAPILVFGPLATGELDDIWEYRLTPTITDIGRAEALSEHAAGRTLPIHVKLDTGLSRAGVAPRDALPLLEKLAELPSLAVDGVYSHFASADEPDTSSTLRQLRIFREILESLQRHGHTFEVKHISNSAASLNFPEAHLDMIRAGISTYGYYPSESVKRSVRLMPALSLLSVVTRVHSIPAGAGVGYGHEFRASRESMIALVPIGYGDGLPRSLGNGRGHLLIRGKAAPIVGRVSMDQITADVTDIGDVALGDEVVIIGSQDGAEQSADIVARQAGTISYDILTGLMPRIPRVYTRSDGSAWVLRHSSHLEPLAGDSVPAEQSSGLST
ncbi:MAG TPA: alanine racemase [Chloroflexota bacterium]